MISGYGICIFGHARGALLRPIFEPHPIVMESGKMILKRSAIRELAFCDVLEEVDGGVDRFAVIKVLESLPCSLCRGSVGYSRKVIGHDREHDDGFRLIILFLPFDLILSC